MLRPRTTFAALALSLAVGAGPGHAAEPPALDGPLTPDAAPKSFRLQPGLKIELVAAEPMVVSPVALAFDERGRLFVAEDRGYPTGPPPGQGPVGRVALLEDTDGDGRMDRRTEFAEGLTYPNGVLPWDGGLIVTCAPDVLYLKDTDGDGKADERKVLFTGFSTTGSTQLRVSHPTLGPDGWVYLTSGLTGGKVTCPAHPDRPPVVLGRTDFRFKPDLSAYEPADGGAQFGQTFDDAGHRFICYNRVQVQHVVIPRRVLQRNPHLSFSETVQNCPADTEPEPLKGHGRAARLYPISRNVTTADSHAGTFTAACAVFVYRGNGLPHPYLNDVFSCDPTGNLVHADRLVPDGATFSAHAATEKSEFLASTDNWFRPVFLASGPDGALYVVDMYRKTIEHPDYLPVEVRKRTDFEGGKTMGHLWRVVRDDAKAVDLKRLRGVDLSHTDTPALCDLLRNPNGWHRDTAFRLLLARHDPAAAEPLTGIASDPKAPTGAAVQALALLEALGKLSDGTLKKALASESPGVRENALRLVETRLVDNVPLIRRVCDCADDPDPRVRFQAAITMGSARTSAVPPDLPVLWSLARIAARDGGDRWTRAAVLSTVPTEVVNSGSDALLICLRSLAGSGASLSPDLLTDLGRFLAAGAPRSRWPLLVRGVMEANTETDSRIVRGVPAPGGGPARKVDDGFPPADRAALLTGMAEAVRGKLGPGAADVLGALAGEKPRDVETVRAVVDAMARVAPDESRPLDRRREAVALLGFAGFDRAGGTLLNLVDGPTAAPLRVAAVRALGTQRDPRAASALLERSRFAGYTPAIREEVLSALLAQKAHVPAVLDAVADGRIPASAIDALRRRQLAQNPDKAVRERAAALFGSVSGDRAKVYEAYKDVVSLPADPAKGRAVFRRECAQCHRLDQEGHAVGPDLFGIRNQPKEAILLHILVPDHEITSGFSSYTVATKDGRILTGLIASETPASVTLRQPLGKEDTIPRDEIDAVSAGSQSLMPSGLEKTVTRQEFADLLSYLKGEGAGGP